MLNERVRILVVLSAGAERYVLAACFAVAGKDTAERGVGNENEELADSARERERGEVVGRGPTRWVRVWAVDGQQVPPQPCITREGPEGGRAAALGWRRLTRGRKAWRCATPARAPTNPTLC